MFSFLDLNVPIVTNNYLSEVNVASVEQGNISAYSADGYQDNYSAVGQSTGDLFDVF